MNTYRQGDVLFIQIDSIPEDAKPQISNIVVEGETTGHAHRLQGGQIMITATAMYIACHLQASHIVHEEHRTITLPPGVYEVRRQREYVSPELTRQVLD